MSLILGFLHGLDFAFTGLAVGSQIFLNLVLPSQGAIRSKTADANKMAFSIILLIAFLLSILWCLCLCADMAESWSPTEIWAVITQTSFGHVWSLKLALMASLLVINQVKRLRPALWLVLGLPLFLGLSGHAGAQQHHYALSNILDYFHFLGVSLWTGGLFNLYLWLKNYSSRDMLQTFPGRSPVMPLWNDFLILQWSALPASRLLECGWPTSTESHLIGHGRPSTAASRL